MNSVMNFLYKCPHPFIVIDIKDNKIKNIEYNNGNSSYNDIDILNITKDKNIKEFIEKEIGQDKKVSLYKMDKEEYKFTYVNIYEDKYIVWVEKKNINGNSYNIDYLCDLAHEFKTPLNIIFGSIQLINKKLEIDDEISIEDLQKYINIIDSNSYRMLKLTKKVLDENNLFNEKKEYNPINDNIVYFVENICDSTSNFATVNNIEIIFDTDIEELVISFDKDKIESLILNLISNAIKFRKEKHGKIEVQVSHNEKEVCIKIKDNGIGIEKNKLDKIFKKFIRLNNKSTMLQEGSGIGLSLVDSIVQLHEGRIEVDSEIGGWTEFDVYLPNKKIEYSENIN